MYTPRRAEGRLALRNCHGLPFVAPWNGPPSPSPPPALGKYSGQAVANTLLTQWRGGGDRGGAEEGRERKAEGKVVRQPKRETRGVQDLALAHVPQPFFGVF